MPLKPPGGYSPGEKDGGPFPRSLDTVEAWPAATSHPEGGEAEGLPLDGREDHATDELRYELEEFEDLINISQLTPDQVSGCYRKKHFEDAVALVRKARDSFSAPEIKPGTLLWRCAGDCQRPFVTVIRGRSTVPTSRVVHSAWTPQEQADVDRLLGKVLRSSPTIHVEIETRCRKCDSCRAARAALWRNRAIVEIGKSTRSWFGTLTLAPQWQQHYLNVARSNLAAQGLDYDGLAYDDQFRTRCGVIGPELQRYLKRIRKESGPFRYLLVAEAHKSGSPHYHCLMHERSVSAPLRKECLQRQYHLGFSQFKLVRSPIAAVYVAKYLSKSAAARVRASLRYGQELTERDTADRLPPSSLSQNRTATHVRENPDHPPVAQGRTGGTVQTKER